MCVTCLAKKNCFDATFSFTEEVIRYCDWRNFDQRQKLSHVGELWNHFTISNKSAVVSLGNRQEGQWKAEHIISHTQLNATYVCVMSFMFIRIVTNLPKLLRFHTE